MDILTSTCTAVAHNILLDSKVYFYYIFIVWHVGCVWPSKSNPIFGDDGTRIHRATAQIE